MNIKDFYQLVTLEREPEAGMQAQLKYLTQKYPFFQAGIFTYVKCLYLADDELFRPEQKRLSAFVIDRKALFYYVMNNEFREFEKQAEKKLTQDRTDILINAFFDTLTDKEDEERELEHAIVNSSMASLDYFSYLESSQQVSLEGDAKSKTDELLENFDFTLGVSGVPSIEAYSIDDEGLTDDTVSVSEISAVEDIPAFRHQDIIDSFISKAENKEDIRIKIDKADLASQPEEEYSDADMDGNASDKELDDDIFFTQTLANIYIKQKKYNRAYEIIKRLSLNYPEKNTYFADQLSFLEKLIKNSNKKTK